MLEFLCLVAVFTSVCTSAPKRHIFMYTVSLVSKAAVTPAALTFHCTVTPGSTNSGLEHSHKLQHHLPVRSAAETAEYRLMCSTGPICMGSGESAEVWRGDAEEGERKEDEPVFLLRSWRKQAGLVCIVWVTFVKWALLFHLLHYSNTCYWDHWRAHWYQCGVRLSHRVDQSRGDIVHLFWESKQLIHMSPNEGWKGCGTFPQSSQCTVTYVLSWSWGVWEPAETKTRLGASVCVWVRAIVSHGAKLCNMCWCRGSHSSRDKGAPAWPSPFVSVIWRGA